MGRWLLASKVALLLLASVAEAAATSTLPPTFILLPLSSFSNASLIAPYNCNPVLTSRSCNGHGDCHLLLDGQADYAQLYVNSSTADPIPAWETSLDVHGIDADTLLPAAVCLCDTGYTGRGDYISYYALDGDSCGINRPAIVALCSLGIVEFTIVLLLAFHRLYRWHVWHEASVADSANWTRTFADVDSYPSSGHHHGNEPNNVPPILSPVTHTNSSSRVAEAVSTLTPSAGTPSPKADPATPTGPLHPTRSHRRTPTIGGGPIRIHARAATEGSTVVVKTKSQRRQLLYRHLGHITFLHPLLSVAVALLSITLFALRAGTDWTLNVSYTMSVLLYVQHVTFLLASSLAVLNTLRAASAITRTQTGVTAGVTGLSTVNRWAKRCLAGLCVYASIVCLLVFLVRADNSQQQLITQLNLCICYTPISILGLVSVVATRRITGSLVLHLDLLSAQQQRDRLEMARKLRRQSLMKACLLSANTLASFVLALEPQFRQVGVPYFALIIQTSTAIILAGRLLLLRTQPAKRAVAPAPMLLPSAIPLYRLMTASEVRVNSKGSGRAQGSSGSTDGSEASVVTRSPNKLERTMSARAAGAGGTLASGEQSSHTRASSDVMQK